MPSNVHLTVKNFKKIKRATGVIKRPVEQYSKKKTGIRYTSKDSMTILPGIDDEYTIDDLT
jgi:hypothetical protein